MKTALRVYRELFQQPFSKQGQEASALKHWLLFRKPWFITNTARQLKGPHTFLLAPQALHICGTQSSTHTITHTHAHTLITHSSQTLITHTHTHSSHTLIAHIHTYAHTQHTHVHKHASHTYAHTHTHTHAHSHTHMYT